MAKTGSEMCPYLVTVFSSQFYRSFPSDWQELGSKKFERGQEALFSFGPVTQAGLLLSVLVQRLKTPGPLSSLHPAFLPLRKPPAAGAPPPRAPGAVREKVSLGVWLGQKGQSTRRWWPPSSIQRSDTAFSFFSNHCFKDESLFSWLSINFW